MDTIENISHSSGYILFSWHNPKSTTNTNNAHINLLHICFSFENNAFTHNLFTMRFVHILNVGRIIYPDIANHLNKQINCLKWIIRIHTQNKIGYKAERASWLKSSHHNRSTSFKNFQQNQHLWHCPGFW